MKPNAYQRFFYGFLPIGLLAVGLGLQTYSSYQHHATGDMVLYGMALIALLGLALYLALSHK